MLTQEMLAQEMLTRISRIVAECQRFLITSHVRPDGDALGSEIALYLALRSMGKEVFIYNQDSVPETYGFLPGSEAVSGQLGDVNGYDAIFVLDCSELDRVGRLAEAIKKARYVINIDHHVTRGGFADICLVDPDASSTGELVYRLLKEIKAEVTPDIAVNLYTAILTDTGSFHYSNTGVESFRIAAELVAAGADPSVIAQNIYESNPLAKVRLFKKAIQTLELEWDGKIGSMSVFQQMLREAEAKTEHTENFVDFVRAIKGVEVAVFYTEMEDSFFKVSLRSKGLINVEIIAGHFGGGGHPNAAACRIYGDLEYVRSHVMRAITGA